ncbi:heme ABC transporter ATP-binding protein [Paraglaciecola chathamensis]|uniref:heme ABC transporter ATP-binding protein n=1 Tax=Paraglaciecola chathamensis TaxID=368405 RepID=UPI002706FE72|nr:heme ABC transporter ATP-binding protein [Paraglaciecola chathamensis]MDO6841907.1 heme ABC transporter ATP-binding protein [Paraglaciecola chathamensis]
MLIINNVSVKRGVKTCVNNVSARFRAGQFTALVGPNGAGKSSLLKAICGEWPRSSGNVLINGIDSTKLAAKERAKMMAVMPQHPRISFDFRVHELVRLGRSPHSIHQVDSENDVIDYCLQIAGLEGYAQRGVLTLSGGELQRVYLAKAIAQISTKAAILPGKNTVLLLDEPTSALDMAQQLTAMNGLREIARNGGTVVAVMHDLNLVSCFADHVLLMQDAEVLEQGAPEQVLQPKNLKDCFGCNVWVDKRASDKKVIVSVG